MARCTCSAYGTAGESCPVHGGTVDTISSPPSSSVEALTEQLRAEAVMWLTDLLDRVATELSRLTEALAQTELRAEAAKSLVRTLQAVCGEAYQAAGACDAPVRVLDQLSAAAAGRPLPHASMLPVTDEEVGLRLRTLQAERDSYRRGCQEWNEKFETWRNQLEANAESERTVSVEAREQAIDHAMSAGAHSVEAEAAQRYEQPAHHQEAKAMETAHLAKARTLLNLPPTTGRS